MNNIVEEQQIGAPKRIVIFGMVGAGKTTLAQRIGDKYNLRVFHTDNYRYYPNTWNKLPYNEFMTNLMSALNESGEWVVEGAFYDAHDPLNSRPKQMLEVIKQADRVICLKEPLQVLTENLLCRCHERMNNDGRGGYAVETFASQARLVTKVISNYDSINAVISVFCDLLPIIKPDINLLVGDRVNVYHQIGLV